MAALYNARCEKYIQISVLTAFGFILQDCVFHLSKFGNTQVFQVSGSLKNTTNYTMCLFTIQKKARNWEKTLIMGLLMFFIPGSTK
jgi:hypothetical protein